MGQRRIVTAVLVLVSIFMINGIALADVADPGDTNPAISDSDSIDQQDGGGDAVDASTDDGKHKKDDGGCSYASGPTSHFGAQWILVGALVGLGLFIRRGSRR